MFSSTLITIALIVAPAIQGALADFAINTPALTQCKDAKISWEATKGPYNLIVVHADNPCGDALADLGDHDGTSFTWKAALPVGAKVQLSLEDANGDEAWSGQITVAKSDDSSCLPADPAKPKPVSQSTTSVTSVTPGTTLVAAPNAGTTVVTTSSSVVPSAVGAAGNAGANPFASNGALTMRHASTPIMVLGALAAVFAFSL